LGGGGFGGGGFGGGGGVVPPMLHAVPFSANEPGRVWVAPLWLPFQPGLAVAFVPSVPFHVALRMVTLVPLCVCTPFHDWVICWPAAYVKVSVQPPEIGSPVFLISMFVLKPPGHELTL
jgi:hypothetical protein